MGRGSLGGSLDPLRLRLPGVNLPIPAREALRPRHSPIPEAPMAVEIPPENAWNGRAVVVASMREVAASPVAWARYLRLTLPQREAFRTAVGLEFVITLGRVLEVARVPAPAPVVAPPPPTPRPESILAFQGDAISFHGWLQRQAALVVANAGLSFLYGARYTLSDGTVSVPISIARDGVEVLRTGFVFHYHPGASGPSVGHGYASSGHFKPRDGAPKHVRVEQHQFRSIEGDLCQEARRIARSAARR